MNQEAPTGEAEETAGEEKPEFVHGGCEFVCRAEAAAEAAQALRAAVDEVLHLFNDDQIIDYGVGSAG